MGDPPGVCQIEIDGNVCWISKNISEALHSIRTNTNIRTIWADAICINQADDDEKSWQVGQMGMIYRRAEAVVSWLGPANPRDRQTFADLQSLQGKEVWTNAGLFNFLQSGEGVQKRFCTSESFLALKEILEKPYWARIWILQELVSAKERIYLCGNMCLKDVDRILCFLLSWPDTGTQGATQSVRSQLTSTRGSITVLAVKAYQLRNRTYDFRAETYSLIHLLRGLRHLEAPDAGDLIFALMSISQDWEGMLPDYSKTVEAVFTETAINLLAKGNHDILLDAINLPRRPGLPSWAPNWEATSFQDIKFESNMYRLHGRVSSLKLEPEFPTLRPPKMRVWCNAVARIACVGQSYRDTK